MKKKRFYTAIILLSFLAAGTQPALAVNFAWTLLPPGQIPPFGTWDLGTETFTLTSNPDPGDSIQISKSGVTLDGAGFSFTGPGPSGAAVQILGQNGITIKNLNITGFSIGIYIDNSNLLPAEPKINTFQNNTITNTTAEAIRIYLTNATVISGNNILNNYWGIQVDNSGNGDTSYDYRNYVSGNTLTNNAGGIWLRNSSYNNVETNIATGPSFAGIYLSVGSGNNVLAGNTASNNDHGILLRDSSDNTVSGNGVSGNTWGIWIDPSNNNTITENDISNNAQGIYIEDSSFNEVYNNNFIDNTTYHAYVTGGSGNVFNLADPAVGGNYWSGWSSSDPYVFTGGQDGSPWTEQDGWVVDTTPPEITCPGDTSIEAMEPDGVPIDDDRIQTFLAGASATDNVDPQEAIIITNNAPSLFPPGDTTVTFTATDTSGNFSTCQSTVTVVEAAESSLRIIPRIINREGRLTKILAVIRFPAGTTEEDIDISQPLMLYPGDSPDGIEAINQRIVTWYRCGVLRVSVFARFSKDEVTAGVPENGPAELMVIGRFESGQYFYGFDNVWICSWSW